MSRSFVADFQTDAQTDRKKDMTHMNNVQLYRDRTKTIEDETDKNIQNNYTKIERNRGQKDGQINRETDKQIEVKQINR